MLFGRPPRTPLDSLVPLEGEPDTAIRFNNFVERRKQDMREVRLALEKRHSYRAAAKEEGEPVCFADVAGRVGGTGSLVLVR